MLRRHPLRDAITVALFAVAVPSAVFAQQQEKDPNEVQNTLDTVTVTGSNIPRTSSETASPVQVLTRQDIERSGKATITELLQTLTVDGQGSIPKSFGNGFASGGGGVSLRGLGAGSTLVLLNGRRMAPYGLADDGQKVFTDLGTIPMEAVQSVEVLKDGASAIYGSDAIAGVVNIILRPNFRGLVAKVTGGMSGDGDGGMTKASLTFGGGDMSQDGINAFGNLEIGKTNGVMMSDRANRKWIGNSDLRPYGYTVSGGAGLVGAITGGGAAAGNSPVGAVRNPTTGLYQSLPGCSKFSTITPQDAGGGCLWDVAQFRMITPDEKFINLFVRATATINDSAELYTEFGYSKKQNFFQTTPSGVSGAWGYPGGPVNASSGPGAVVLGPNHPDNPYGVDARLRYAAFDVGPRTSDVTNQFNRILFGVLGTVGNWNYDAAYLHSGTSLTSVREGFLRYSAVRTALTGVDAQGKPSPVGYWRIGDDAYRNTQALYDFISPTISARGHSGLDMVDAKFSRYLWDLKGGPMGLAIGAEYRRQSTELTPTTYTDIGDIIGLGYSSYKGTEKVGVAYAEVLAPVLPSLELTGALRVDSYNEGPIATTPKVGIKWTPASWIALRGTYAEGFRAPNAAESGDGGLAAYGSALDTIRCVNGKPLPGGLPTDCNVSNVAIITNPNPNLKPEESESYNFGLILEPVKNSSITVDAWRIKRKNEINQGSTAEAIRAGHTTRSDNNLPGIPNSGSLLAVMVDYINSASTTVEGVDVDVRQRFDLGNSKLTFDAQWSRINNFTRVEADGTVHEFAGTHGNCDVTNCVGTPKNRINAGVTLVFGTFSVSAIANHIGSFKNVLEESDTECASHFANGDDAPNGCRIPSFTTMNLTAKWKPMKSFEFQGGVQNVFDRIAPIDPLTYGAVNYNPLHFSGAMGRYFTLSVKYSM